MYDYRSNVIWSHPIQSHNSNDLIIGFEACYKELSDTNITLILHRLDNEVSDDLITVIKKKQLKHQIVAAHDHCQSPVKRAISTFKITKHPVFMVLINYF